MSSVDNLSNSIQSFNFSSSSIKKVSWKGREIEEVAPPSHEGAEILMSSYLTVSLIVFAIGAALIIAGMTTNIFALEVVGEVICSVNVICDLFALCCCSLCCQ